MKSNDFAGIIILVSIIGIALLGGVKNKDNGVGFFSIQPSPVSTPTPVTQTDTQNANIQQQIDQTEAQVEALKKQLAEQEAAKNNSRYKGLVTLSYINRSTDPAYEYVLLRMSYNATTSINVTGWTLKSTASGISITIPKATYLYFSGTQNSEEDIVLENQDALYLITGISPNGASFKLNKCSGYLQQFQTFTPSLSYMCPAPRDENLSSIPRTNNNDACFDYIDSMPSCRIQTDSLPANWSYECTRFIYDKINYPSCVNTHKNDKDFYQHDWRVYLKRSERLWKDRRENVVLYDRDGKIVDFMTY